MRDIAVSHWKDLEKRNKLIAHQFQKLRGKGGAHNTLTVPNPPPTPTTSHGSGSNYSQQSPSLAEITLQNYQGKPPNELNSSWDVPSVFNPEIKLSYPFNSELDYVSKYPMGFKGCFTCGSKEHWKSDDCPKVQSGQANKQVFLKNYGLINHG